MPNAMDRCEVVSTGVLKFRGGEAEGTIYRCKWCKKELKLKVKGIYEKLDESGKKSHVDTLNEYHKRHCKEAKCTQPAAAIATTTAPADESYFLEDSEEEEDTCTWKPSDAPAGEWKQKNLEHYLLRGTDRTSLPELFKIVGRKKNPYDDYSLFYICVFRDAQQYLSQELFIEPSTLLNIPQYKDAFTQARDEMDIKEWLDTRIDDLVKEEEYYEPPKKKPRPSGLFKRNTNPKCAYHDLLQALRDTYLKGGRCYSLSKDCIRRILDQYDLTDYAAPKTISDSKLLQSTAQAMLEEPTIRLANAALFVKPTAMHAWLSRCQLMEQPTIRLALFDDLSQLETVQSDPYGFNTLTMHELRLYLWPINCMPPFKLPTCGEPLGILCAVVTLPSLETKTAAYTVRTRSLRADLIVHDMRVVLPLGRV